MRDTILAALNEAGVKTEGLNDTELLAAYNKLNAPAEDKGADAQAIADAVANAVKPLQDKLEAIESAANAAEEQAKAELVEQAVELGLDEADAKAMSANSLKTVIGKMGGAVAFNAFGGQMQIGNKDAADELPSFDA
jgi:hypothetical protein